MIKFVLDTVSGVEFWTGAFTASVIIGLGIYAHYKYR